MAYFMCQYCGCSVNSGLERNVPSDKCPECDQSCAFVNVTCYTPECGDERNPDPKIMAYVLDRVAVGNKKNTRVGLAQRTSIGSDGNALCYEAALIALRELRDQLMATSSLRKR